MEDLLLLAIQKSYIEPTALEGALLLGRAGLYLHEQSLTFDRTTVEGEKRSVDMWEAAQLLFSLRELVREVGRRYVRGL